MYANRIRELRRRRQVSSTELAYRAGCGLTSLWAYERGERQPSLSIARALARELDATVDELFPDDSVAVAS